MHLLDPVDDSDTAVATGSSAIPIDSTGVPIDFTPSSRRRRAYTSSKNKASTNNKNSKESSISGATSKHRGNFKGFANRPNESDNFIELQEQIDHYINELIQIRDSIKNK